VFGRGEYADDRAVDLWPLPDGAALVAGVNLANLVVGRGEDGEFEPPSAGGTAFHGAVLAYPIHDLDDRQIRIVRLGPGGELLWQIDEDGASVSDLEQTAEADSADGTGDGVADHGFVLTACTDLLSARRQRRREVEDECIWRVTGADGIGIFLVVRAA
jgi:hypothetical protein